MMAQLRRWLLLYITKAKSTKKTQKALFEPNVWKASLKTNKTALRLFIEKQSLHRVKSHYILIQAEQSIKHQKSECLKILRARRAVICRFQIYPRLKALILIRRRLKQAIFIKSNSLRELK